MPNKTFVKVSGVWEEIDDVEVRVSGVWKPTMKAYVKVSGVWKKCHDFLFTWENATFVNMYCFGGYSDATHYKVIEKWNGTTSVVASGELAETSVGNGAATLNALAYIYGGYNQPGATQSDTISKYDESSLTVETATLTALWNEGSAAYLDGKNYIYAGDPELIDNLIQTWDGTTRLTDSLVMSISLRTADNTTWMNGNNYMYGGYSVITPAAYSSSIIKNTAAAVTTESATVNRGIARAFCGWQGGINYIFGGWDISNNDSTEIRSYDETTSTLLVAVMANEHSYGATGNVGSNLHTMGGDDSAAYDFVAENRIGKWNGTAHSWESTTLTNPKMGSGGASLE